MIAWLLATTLPILPMPVHAVGADPRFGKTCAATQTVFVTSMNVDSDLDFVSLNLQGVARGKERLRDALHFADFILARSTRLTSAMRETLEIPALVRADPPTLANGDRMGEALVPLLAPQQAEIDAVRSYTLHVRQAPRLPHPDGVAAVQRARDGLQAVWKTSAKRWGTACGFPEAHPSGT